VFNTIEVTPSVQACGAKITGIDLSAQLTREQIREIRSAWLEHHVIYFTDQNLVDDDLERIGSYFGTLAEDPFFAPLPGRTYTAAIRREANDTNPIFAEGFHSDWSFMPTPPIGTILYGLDIPPGGGDTYFINQHKALSEMPEELRAKLDGKLAIHSAKYAYSPTGFFEDEANMGSMDIVLSDTAYDEHMHPLVQAHPETGKMGLFGAPAVYIVGIDGMEAAEAQALVGEMHNWQTQEQFVYRHQWQNGMLTLWDNRSVLHRASGGYEGYRRELHRVTVYA